MPDSVLHFKFTHDGKTHRFLINHVARVITLIAVRDRVHSIIDSADNELCFFWRDADSNTFPLETPKDLDNAIMCAQISYTRGPTCIHLVFLATHREDKQTGPVEMSPILMNKLGLTSEQSNFDFAPVVSKEEHKTTDQTESEERIKITQELRDATACLQQIVLDMKQQQLQQQEQIEQFMEMQERALYYSPEEAYLPSCPVMNEDNEDRPYLYTPPPFAVSGYDDCTAPCCAPEPTRCESQPTRPQRPVCSNSGYTGCLFNCCDASAQYSVTSHQQQKDSLTESPVFYRGCTECCCDRCLTEQFDNVEANLKQADVNDEMAELKESIAALEMAQAVQTERFELRQNLLLEKLMVMEEMVKK